MDISFKISDITEYGLMQKITGSSNHVDYFKSKFGAISNDAKVFVVGEPLGGPNGTAGIRGTASVYIGSDISGWNLKQTFTGNSQQNYFGTSVAINHDGTMIAIAQPSTNVNSNRGRISIYTGNATNGWAYQDSITSRIGGTYTYDSVMAFSKSGNLIVMGHPNGSVWAYRSLTGYPSQYWDAGVEIPIYFQAGATSISTNTDGSIIVIGRPADGDNGANAGAIHVLTGNPNMTYNGASPWVLKQKITGSQGSLFGYSTAISDNNIIMVGAPSDNERGSEAGAVLFYTGNKNSGWTRHFKEMAYGSAGANYGLAVTINPSGNFFGYSIYRDQAIMYLGDPSKDLYNRSFNKIATLPIIHSPTHYSCSISTSNNASTVLIAGVRGYYNENSDYDYTTTAYLCTVNLPKPDQIVFFKRSAQDKDVIFSS